MLAIWESSVWDDSQSSLRDDCVVTGEFEAVLGNTAPVLGNTALMWMNRRLTLGDCRLFSVKIVFALRAQGGQDVRAP